MKHIDTLHYKLFCASRLLLIGFIFCNSIHQNHAQYSLGTAIETAPKAVILDAIFNQPTNICDCPTGYLATGFETDRRDECGAASGNALLIPSFKLICREVLADGTLGQTSQLTCENGQAVNGQIESIDVGDQNKGLVGLHLRGYNCPNFLFFLNQLQGRDLNVSEIANFSNPENSTFTSAIGSSLANDVSAASLVPKGRVVVGMQGYRGVNGTGSFGFALRHARLFGPTTIQNFEQFQDVLAAFNQGGANQIIHLETDLIANSAPINLTNTMDTLWIHGHGHQFDGQGIFQLINNQSSRVFIDSLNFANGLAAEGGAIYNRGTLYLDDCNFNSNRANQHGGAIFNDFGSIVIKDCRFITNESGFGGGFCTENGTAVIDKCLFSNNISVLAGGAISLLASDTLTLSKSTIIGNSAERGGGIFTPVSTLQSPYIDISNTTIAHNQASDLGGGIYKYAGTIKLNHSTITKNEALHGSGIYAIDAEPIGLANEITIYNSIIGSNDVGLDLSLTSDFQNYNPYTLVENNLIGTFDNRILDLGTNNQMGVTDLGLQPQAMIDNLTSIFLPMFDSPAVDAIQDPCTSCESNDQRGINRPVGLAYDIGAVEYDGPCFSQQVWNVSNTQELNEAIHCFNLFPTDKIINITNDITLDTPMTPIQSVGGDLNIQGNEFTISGANNYRVFEFKEDTNSPLVQYSIQDLHITNGFDFQGSGGAGILNRAQLELTNCIVSNCFSNGHGGAIMNDASGILNVRNSLIHENHAEVQGGGLFLVGQTNMYNSTISSNTANFNGGGGISVVQQRVFLYHCTVTQNNDVNLIDGGIKCESSTAGNCVIFNSFVAGNTGNDLSISGIAQASVYLIDQSIIGNTNAALNATSSMFGDDGSSLLTLTDNGGFSNTHALASNSPAINFINQNQSNETDQRGFMRTRCGGSDAGAFELQEGLQRIYVDKDATGNANGNSWEHAFPELQAGIDQYLDGCSDTLWVAEGSYSPGKAIDGSNDQPRAFVFHINRNIHLLGGFSGIETEAEQRQPWNYETILDGDLGPDGQTYHVLWLNPREEDIIDNRTLIDGFHIQGGFADGSDLDSLGGGLMMIDAAPRLHNLEIQNNYAKHGAAIFDGKSIITNAQTKLFNVLAYENESIKSIFGSLSIGQTFKSSILHSTITHNTLSNTSSSAILLHESLAPSNSEIVIQNSIIWNDGHTALKATNAHFDLSYSMVNATDCTSLQGLDCGPQIQFNINPQFENPQNQNYNLIQNSSAVDAAITIDTSMVDLAGVQRHCIPDLGALELVKDFLSSKIYVNPSATGTADGQSWANAFTNFQDAIDMATIECIDTIWLAAGTYKPSQESDGTTDDPRSYTFFMQSDIKIFGGFSGNETALSERNIQEHVTILSGDIGVEGDIEDNCYHVLYTQNAQGGFLLDGITITGGNANGQGINAGGGGWYMDGLNGTTSPSVNQCIFEYNEATFGGAIYINGENGIGSPIITRSRFSNNDASIDGGAIFSWAFLGTCNPQILNCLFYDNTAFDDGAAILIYVQFGFSDPIIDHCTFHNNQAGDEEEGGAIGIDCTFGFCYPQITRSIFWQNSSTIYNTNSEPDFVNCLIQESSCPVGIDCFSAMLYAQNPLFVNQVTQDYNLNICSQAIDFVNIGASLTTDFDGNPRPMFGGPDLGAFESQLTLNESGYTDVNKLTGLLQSSTVYQTTLSIESEQVIRDDTDPIESIHVIYNAGQNIDFLPGFEITLPNTLETQSDGCQ